MKIYKYILVMLASCVTCMVKSQEVVHSVQLYGDDSDVQIVEVFVNGHKVRFYLDTGCYDVAISQEMFDELKKAKAIKLSDYTGEKKTYSYADERTGKGKVFYIDNLTIGDVVLHDIQAHVAITSNKKASMLLGHSVLKKFRWYMIKDKTMTFEVKDSAVMAFQTIEENAEFMFYKDKGEKKVIEILEPYINDYRFTDYSMYLYAMSLSYAKREKDAVPFLKQLLQRHYETADVLYELCGIYHNDESEFKTYAKQLIEFQLSEFCLTEENLLKKKYDIDYLGYVYYCLSIYAYNNDENALEKRYLKISKNLGYEPKKK